jgi:hypothetical protein
MREKKRGKKREMMARIDRKGRTERERERDRAYTCMRPIACSVYQIDRWTERYHHDT